MWVERAAGVARLHFGSMVVGRTTDTVSASVKIGGYVTQIRLSGVGSAQRAVALSAAQSGSDGGAVMGVAVFDCWTLQCLWSQVLGATADERLLDILTEFRPPLVSLLHESYSRASFRESRSHLHLTIVRKVAAHIGGSAVSVVACVLRGEGHLHPMVCAPVGQTSVPGDAALDARSPVLSAALGDDVVATVTGCHVSLVAWTQRVRESAKKSGSLLLGVVNSTRTSLASAEVSACNTS